MSGVGKCLVLNEVRGVKPLLKDLTKEQVLNKFWIYFSVPYLLFNFPDEHPSVLGFQM